MAKTRKPPGILVRNLPGVVMIAGSTSVFFALQAVTSSARIAIVLGVVTVVLLLWWSFGQGWRLRNPFHRLPSALPSRTPEEEARREMLRELRTDLRVLFHARMKPATAALDHLLREVVGDLNRHSQLAGLSGDLLEAYVSRQVESSERGLRVLLESSVSEPDMARVREFVLDQDLDKKTPDDYGWAFYLHHLDYRMLLVWTRLAASAIDKSLDELDGFAEWHSRDQSLVEKVREVFSHPDLASFRDSLEDDFKK